MNEVVSNAEAKNRLEAHVKDLLRSIFLEAQGSYLTPDVAMEILEEILGSRISSFEAQPNEANKHPLFLRADMAVFRRKIHHYAVDLFYDFYFPRRTRNTGVSKRGAPAIPLEYLDELLRMTRKGMNLEKMADKLGQIGPGRRDRVRKQRDLAIKLYSETVESIHHLGAAQRARDAAKAALQPAIPDPPPKAASSLLVTPKQKSTRRK